MSLRIKVLHIEDDPIDAIIIQEMFSETAIKELDHYEISHREDIEGAFEDIKKNDYDIILLDLGLNNDCSLAHLSKIRQYEPNIPIIIFTGLDNKKVALNALRKGAQDYIIKGQGDRSLLEFAMLSSIQRKTAEVIEENRQNYNPITGLMNYTFFKKNIQKKNNPATAFLILIRINNIFDVLQALKTKMMYDDALYKLYQNMRGILNDILGADCMVSHFDRKTLALYVTNDAQTDYIKTLYKALRAPIFRDDEHHVTLSLSIAASQYMPEDENYHDLIKDLQDIIEEMRYGGTQYKLLKTI